MSYPSDPIAPGDSVTVSVTYDPKERPFGEFIKAVRLRPSTGRQNVFFVKGEIRRTYRRTYRRK